MKSRTDTRMPDGSVRMGLKQKYTVAPPEGKLKGKPTGKKK